MAKRKIPGLSKSSGMQSAFVVFPAGKYVFQLVKWDEVDSAKGTSTIHKIRYKCLEALDANNADYENKFLSYRLIEMHSDHSSFEKWAYIFTDELKSMVDAASITFKADTLDFGEFLDKEFILTITQVDSEDAEGNPRKENKIVKYESV
jgi:hypothetical protein